VGIQQVTAEYHKEKTAQFLHHVKPIEAGFTGMGPTLSSALWGPYSHKTHLLGLYPTLNITCNRSDKKSFLP
jgi:hypothetical protein